MFSFLYTPQQSRARILVLASRNSTTLLFTWNTTDLAKGNYLIEILAEPVPDEIDTTDNYCLHWLTVSMIGDITGPDSLPDGKVDMRDIGTAAGAFGSYPGHARWNQEADITGVEYLVPDNKVDTRDIALVARHFGETDP